MIKYILILTFLFSTPAIAEFNKADVNSFIEYMHSEYSYDKSELRSLFDDIKPESRIKKFFKKAPERTLARHPCDPKAKNYTHYNHLFITKKTISNG